MNKKEKKCNGCENAEQQEYQHSIEWEMMKELTLSNKRLYIIIVTILCLWFTTIAGFVWHISQYDYSDYEVSTDGGGNAYYSEQIGDGDINYGTNSSSQENIEKSSESKG